MNEDDLRNEIRRLRDILEDNGIDPDSEPVKELYGPPELITHMLSRLTQISAQEMRRNLEKSYFSSNPLLDLLVRNKG